MSGGVRDNVKDGDELLRGMTWMSHVKRRIDRKTLFRAPGGVVQEVLCEHVHPGVVLEAFSLVIRNCDDSLCCGNFTHVTPALGRDELIDAFAPSVKLLDSGKVVFGVANISEHLVLERAMMDQRNLGNQGS